VVGDPCAPDVHRLVTIAEDIERESRRGTPIGSMLDALARETNLASECSSCDERHSASLTRLGLIVAQLRRDIDSGHVKSISGIARAARTLAADHE
jgi:hypothetical protein